MFRLTRARSGEANPFQAGYGVRQIRRQRENERDIRKRAMSDEGQVLAYSHLDWIEIGCAC